MKYLSIDIETTGLDPVEHKIIEFGCLIEDTTKPQIPVSELPHYGCIIRQSCVGNPEALAMNSEIFEMMADWGVSQGAFLRDFMLWCKMNEVPKDSEGRYRIVAAGKNFGSFDLQFLNNMPGFKSIFNISHRALDPSILYIQPTDEELPSLQTCLDRAGIAKTVTHNALGDASDVIHLLRLKYPILNLV